MTPFTQTLLERIAQKRLDDMAGVDFDSEISLEESIALAESKKDYEDSNAYDNYYNN